MDNAKHYDVAIVGYGPTGVTLANLLLKLNLKILVIEREAQILQLPRAIRFDAECMRIFQTIGISEALLKQVAPGPGMKFQDAAGNLMMTWERPTQKGSQQWSAAYRTHQPDLEQLLRAKIAQHPLLDLKLRHELYQVHQHVQHCHLSFENLANGSLIHATADFVVGCDGARSLIRKLMGSTFNDLNLHSQWLVVDFMLNPEAADQGDYTIQFCDPQRPMSYIKGTGQRRRWEIMVMPEDDLKHLTQPETIWALLKDMVDPTQLSIERAAVYTFHALLAQNWVKDRLIIAGDAAHQTPPFMGQGMAAGIRDAANLAWKLDQVIHHHQEISLIQSYFSERLPHATAFVEAAVEFGKIIQNHCTATEYQQLTQQLKNFITPTPRLGTGFYQAQYAEAGMLGPQFLLENQQLSDDLVGYQFALLLDEQQHVIAEWLNFSPKLPIQILPSDIHISTWLKQHGAIAAVLRPDRYIFGFAHDQASFQALLHALGIAIN